MHLYHFDLISISSS